MSFTVKPYKRNVFYYETDNMGIVHHSNYLRWMEEARLDFLHQAGYDYSMMESLGIIMPVTGVSCKYIRPMHYDETFSVEPTLVKFNGIRAAFTYEIRRDNDGTLVATGDSGHCFLDGESRTPINIKKYHKEFYDCMFGIVKEQNA